MRATGAAPTGGADCVFCKIIAGEEPASFVADDDEVVAFMDIQPVNPGHTLVVPRRHAPTAADLDERSASAVWSMSLHIAAAVRRTLRPDGVNFFVADGAAAGQEVFHFHLHVLPRYVGDGFGLRFPVGYGASPPRADLDAMAAKIRAAL